MKATSFTEMTASGVIDKPLCLRPDERAPGRACGGPTGLTIAEYFRDVSQDVLLFIDNIFRFTQAGSEVSRC